MYDRTRLNNENNNKITNEKEIHHHLIAGCSCLEQCQYVPNEIARSLKTQESRTIGVLVPWFQYSFDAFVDEIIVQAGQRKLHLIIFPNNDIPALDSQLIDGAVAVGERISSE